MSKNEITVILGCIVFSLIIFVGSTGLGYAVYRPLRYYDIFSLVIAWIGTLYYLWQGRRMAKGGR